MCCTTNVAIIAVDGGFVNHVSACLKGVADYWAGEVLDEVVGYKKGLQRQCNVIGRKSQRLRMTTGSRYSILVQAQKRSVLAWNPAHFMGSGMAALVEQMPYAIS